MKRFSRLLPYYRIMGTTVSLIVRLALGLAAAGLVKGALGYYTIYAGHLLAIGIERDMRRDFFYHLQRQSFGFFDNRKTGELMSRMINDIEKVTDAVNHAPEEIFLAAVTILGSFSVMFTLNPRLALISFISIPLMFLYSQFFGRRLLSGFEKINDATADINAKVENSISGIRVVQSFTGEKHEQDLFDSLNREFYLSWKGALRNLSWFFSGIDVMRDVCRVIIVLAGGFMVVDGDLSPGTLVAFLFYVGIYLDPIERLTRTNELIQKMAAGTKSFFALLDETPEVRELPGAVDMDGVRGDIVFDDVTFSYNDGRQVFSGLRLSVPAGRTVAIVGPSGAGKTTFCNLIPRFYEPQSGSIRIDGRDIRSFTLDSLRAQIGIVAQDVFLFTGTIRENIAYGRPGASDDEIIEAAVRAHAHSFIAELPAGYDTFIGEKGVKLSGGQKQRISIARVFLKNPRILIFDEATSSLDVKSEQVIQKAMAGLVKGRTAFIIAHRLSTIRHADEIVVLSERGIEQRGTHRELLASEGLYASLYRAQQHGVLPDLEE
jgi:ATP-binding cassette subfamily B protein